MSTFESKIFWRFIVPLSAAAVLSGAANIITTAKMTVAVQGIQTALAQTASEKWVKSQVNFLQYQIHDLEGDINTNGKRIEETRKMIRQYHPVSSSLWYPADPPMRPMPVLHTAQNQKEASSS